MIRSILLASAALAVSIGQSAAFNIQFDYSFDSNGFFDVGSAERNRLEDAATFFEEIIVDDLNGITPGGNNGWTATFANPSFDVFGFNPIDPNTFPAVSVSDLVVQPDTIVVYVGSQNINTGALGEAAPGGFSIGGGADPGWSSNISVRGEAGSTTDPGATDFAPWGGSLSINNTINWDLTPDASGSNASAYHLYSVLLHELGHVLGIGTADSWDEGQHLVPGTMSVVYGTDDPQEAAMDPDLGIMETKFFTDVDVAALEAVGWEIAPLPVPEPSASLLALFASLGFALRRRR